MSNVKYTFRIETFEFELVPNQDLKFRNYRLKTFFYVFHFLIFYFHLCFLLQIILYHIVAITSKL